MNTAAANQNALARRIALGLLSDPKPSLTWLDRRREQQRMCMRRLRQEQRGEAWIGPARVRTVNNKSWTGKYRA